MSVTFEELRQWMDMPSENEHLEFKEAKHNFHFDTLVKYCCALANERGGKMILGVSDKLPRGVVGTSIFNSPERTKTGLIERLHLRVDMDEVAHPDGRVLVFHVPARPLGMPIQVAGAYWMRRGEDLGPMLPDMLKRIFAETGFDFSNEIAEKATMDDLDPMAIEEFRRRWIKKAGDKGLENLTPWQLLSDAEMIRDGGITFAALVLMGKRKSLGELLSNAEVVFEYRSSESFIQHQQREKFREGVFLFYDKLWNLVNARNDLQHYQDGLFIWDIPTFNEEVVREAILNAVCHRDYRLAGSIFIRQFPSRIEIVSPGGFPEGITTDNLLYQQSPRNRRIAEVLARCGLVERSGQGFDKIFTACIRETKPLPDFSRTDAYHVYLTLQGTIQDPAFLRFLEKIGSETQRSFYVDDFLVLDCLRTGKTVAASLKYRLPKLLESGVIERIDKGRGIRYILSKNFYEFSDRKGAYTRRIGLDRETNKALLLKHLSHYRRGSLNEFHQVLPNLSRHQIYSLLKSLKKEKRITFIGSKRGGYWELLE
jgi:ATP-dependent DNA helicase RecG